MIARASRLTAPRVNTSKLSAMFSDTSFSAFSSVCFDTLFSYRMVGCFLLQERPNPSSKRQIFHSLDPSTEAYNTRRLLASLNHKSPSLIESEIAFAN